MLVDRASAETSTVQTAGAAKGRTQGSLEIREGLRRAARGCEHWKIRNAERASWGEANKACQSGELSDRQPARGGEKTAHLSPQTHNWVMELCNPLKL